MTDSQAWDRLGLTNLSSEDRRKIYDEWGEDYDKDVSVMQYVGYEKCSEAMSNYCTVGKDKIKILDVGAGTGLLGESIRRRGFTTIDAIDPSQGMLTIAERKNIYRNIYCKFFTAEPIDVFKDDSYDLVVTSGCYNKGCLPYDAVLEMIRITKPGGLIFLNGRIKELRELPEYAQFFPLLDKLEKDGVWKKEEMSVYEGYHKNTDIDGVLIVYRVI